MPATTISPEKFYEMCSGEKAPLLVDVRTPAEFREVHATSAENIPLDRLNAETVKLRLDPGAPVYLICKSGKRAESAAQRLEKEGIEAVCCVNGGTDNWEASGLPVVRGKATISLERQVRIVAGGLVATGAVLALTVNPWWALLPAFVGCGLVFAGVTDTCGMGMLLAKMPWNQVKDSCKT
jgi:rhodanese-related sulfurtransferase